MNAMRLLLPLCAAVILWLAPAVFANGTQSVAVYVSEQGQRLTACFDIPGKTVRLALPDGRSVTLPVALSGSGARYGDDARTFWEHQGGAIYEEDGRLLFKGRIAPDERAGRRRK